MRFDTLTTCDVFAIARTTHIRPNNQAKHSVPDESVQEESTAVESISIEVSHTAAESSANIILQREERVGMIETHVSNLVSDKEFDRLIACAYAGQSDVILHALLIKLGEKP